MGIKNIKPKFARVLLKRATLQEKMKEKKSSLIIPDSVRKEHADAEGIVVAVGPQCDEQIDVGMRVVFGKYAGDWQKIGDEEFYIVQDEDILYEIVQDGEANG